jgi:7-carboxy-7-deazaguanine synthase (Cx14CxxC type)
MSYQVKEIYYTLQGEGARAGRPAVFLRFAGCNLWSGKEEDREAAACYFCDTDFVGTDGENGGKFASAEDLAQKVFELWPGGQGAYVVCTGGEPGLQLDKGLVSSLQGKGFEVAIESNGTVELPANIDWVTISPKPSSELLIKSGDELKLVFPHEVEPESVSELDFEHFYLMPLDTGDDVKNNFHLQAAVKYCLDNPPWSFCLQVHKLVGIA